jgi:hypothetical protein
MSRRLCDINIDIQMRETKQTYIEDNSKEPFQAYKNDININIIHLGLMTVPQALYWN